jgi:hypothetical protein
MCPHGFVLETIRGVMFWTHAGAMQSARERSRWLFGCLEAVSENEVLQAEVTGQAG